MCLAIPGQIMEIVDERKRLAKVDVAGVRRNVNIGLLDADDGGGVGPGDWVLIHVGFAISQVDEEGARATRELLGRVGGDMEQELEELKASVIDCPPPSRSPRRTPSVARPTASRAVTTASRWWSSRSTRR